MFQTEVVDIITTHLLCSVTFFPENRAIYEAMCKYCVYPDRPQMTIWITYIARRITNATNTPSELVILIAFPLQQWLHERASILSYMYIACLVNLDTKWKSAGWFKLRPLYFRGKTLGTHWLRGGVRPWADLDVSENSCLGTVGCIFDNIQIPNLLQTTSCVIFRRIRILAKSLYYLRHTRPSFRM
jgi:hypothetical protein